jgi:hypothetical protein
MGRVVWLCLCVLTAVVSQAAAQSYQQYSDGLVSVEARKVVDRDGQVWFDTCAQLVRRETACPMEVRLNFWGDTGALLAQASTVLTPEFPAPICTRIPLPSDADNLRRWEVSRFRCQQ